MAETKQVPAELLEQCKEINEQWLNTFYGKRSGIRKCAITPYYFQGDLSEGWRLRLVVHNLGQETSTQTLCDYLYPEKVDGHTMRLFAEACFDAEERGKQLGKKEALLSLFQQQCSAVKLDVEVQLKERG